MKIGVKDISSSNDQVILLQIGFVVGPNTPTFSFNPAKQQP
jgi:hypothetical protein